MTEFYLKTFISNHMFLEMFENYKIFSIVKLVFIELHILIERLIRLFETLQANNICLNLRIFICLYC